MPTTNIWGLAILVLIAVVVWAAVRRAGPKAMLAVGVVGLIAGWSLRPPSGFGDAVMMMGQGRDFFLKEPVFLGVMAVSGLLAVFGLADLLKSRTPPHP